MKHSWKLNIFGKTIMSQFQIIDTPKYPTIGKSSRIPHTHYHVLFLDYDLMDFDTMADELNALIDDYHIGNIYIFKTRENAYHCICFDYLWLSQVKHIVMSSSCDLGFVLAPRYDKFRNWVLRDLPKGERIAPVFVGCVGSKYNGNNKQSSAHAKYITAKYGIPIELANPDGQDELKLESYLTAKRCDEEE